MNTRYTCTAMAAAAALSVAGLAAADNVRGPEWVEGANRTGDAGSRPEDAQTTQGEGPMQGIRGSLNVGFGGGDFEDMYFITITEPTKFVASLGANDGGEVSFDSMIWLFSIVSSGEGGPLALGLLGNDNISSEDSSSRLTQFSDDGSEAFVAEPGLYLLAITRFNNTPFSDGDIYSFETRTEISGPDGPGGDFPFAGWNGEGGGGGGFGPLNYKIAMTGVGFAELPAPGVIPAFALAALVSRRRRRR